MAKNNVFGFLNMANNYEFRKVGRWESDDGEYFVSTVMVSDGEFDYETAIKHPDYNNGEIVIVDKYNTKEEALAGHSKWLDHVNIGPMPNKIGVVNCFLSEIAESLGVTQEFTRNGV